MAETFALDVQARHVVGKQVRQLRQTDLIPAVIYGAGGQALNVSCPRRPLEIMLSKAGGRHLVKLNIDGQEENVLVRAVQRHPVRRNLVHVDFLRVDLSKKLRTEIPLHLNNAVKLSLELTLAHYMTQIEVECLPSDIPDRIEVDLSQLKALGDQITVASLPTSASLSYLADPSDVIARIEASSSGADTEAEAAAEAAASAEPELASTKGKKEDEVAE